MSPTPPFTITLDVLKSELSSHGYPISCAGTTQENKRCRNTISSAAGQKAVTLLPNTTAKAQQQHGAPTGAPTMKVLLEAVGYCMCWRHAEKQASRVAGAWVKKMEGVSSMKKEAGDARSVLHEELEARLVASEKLVAKLRYALKLAREELEEARIEQEALMEEKEELQDELESVKEEKDGLEDEFESLREEVGILQEEKKGLRAELEVLKGVKDEVQGDLETLRERLASV